MGKSINHTSRFGLWAVMSLLGLATQPLQAQLVSYTFTSCGANGQFGPSQGQVTNSYLNTNLSNSVTVVNGGIQNFTIPQSGQWKIEAWGAQGGSSGGTGGLGAYMSGDFTFTAGQVISILVGQQGLGQSGNAAGGGGGSFVALAGVAQLVAGGGSGGNIATVGLPAPVTSPGQPGQQCVNAGATGFGGGDAAACGQGAGGAGGFGGNGASTSSWGAQFGYGFVNGGNGGTSATGNSHGGYGGGAGTHSNNTGGGGGGGYTGGGASSHSSSYVGGAGSSYNIGVNQVNKAGVNSGNGKVILTRMCGVALNSSANPICIGGSVTLSTDAVSGITWSGSPSTGNSIVVSPSVTTSYSVTGTSTANCVSGSMITVTVHPLPTLMTLVTPTTLCVGKTATIVASGASTFTWNGGPTGNSLMVNPGVTTTYNLSGTSQFGCVNSGTVSVNVNTNVLTVSSPVSLCTGNSANLSASGAVTYSWSNGSNFPSIPVSPASNTTYSVDATDIFGCKISGSVPVTVNTSPNVTVNSSKANVCKWDALTLTAGGATTYTWSNNSNGAQLNITVPVDVAYTYTVTGEDANGCTGTAVITINVNKCTGINEFANAGLNVSVYPNPMNHALTVELNNGSAKTIEVMDLSGRIVLTKNSSEQKMDMDVTGLADGIYYVRISSDSKTETFKIVKSN